MVWLGTFSRTGPAPLPGVSTDCLGEEPRPPLGWRAQCHRPLVRALLLVSGVGTGTPLQSSGPSPRGWGQQLCPWPPGRMLPGLASRAPTVPLISWHWPWQQQHTASPSCSAASADLGRPGREGSPRASCCLAAPCPRPTPFLLAAGWAPGRGWHELGSFYLSWPGRVAVLIWADSSCLQRAPQTSRGEACQEVHPFASWVPHQGPLSG